MKNALRVLSMALCLMTISFGETVYFNGKDAKAGYYLVPEKVPQDATKMWVAVDVHGAGGLRGEDRGKISCNC